MSMAMSKSVFLSATSISAISLLPPTSADQDTRAPQGGTIATLKPLPAGPGPIWHAPCLSAAVCVHVSRSAALRLGLLPGSDMCDWGYVLVYNATRRVFFFFFFLRWYGIMCYATLCYASPVRHTQTKEQRRAHVGWRRRSLAASVCATIDPLLWILSLGPGTDLKSMRPSTLTLTILASSSSSSPRHLDRTGPCMHAACCTLPS
jgi:hypothetical protein